MDISKGDSSPAATSGWKRTIRSTSHFFIVQCASNVSCLNEPSNGNVLNQYRILNLAGETIFYAVDASAKKGSISKLIFGPIRSYEIHLYDLSGRHFVTFKHPFSCCLAWFGGHCCGNTLLIHQSASESQLAKVEQGLNISPVYQLKLNNSEVLRVIHSSPKKTSWICSKCTLCFGNGPKFDIVSNGQEKSVIGQIKNDWKPKQIRDEEDPAEDHFTRFGMTPTWINDEFVSGSMFLPTLGEESKIVIMGTLFLLHFLYYDRRNGKLTICDILIYIPCLLLAALGCYKLISAVETYTPGKSESQEEDYGFDYPGEENKTLFQHHGITVNPNEAWQDL